MLLNEKNLAKNDPDGPEIQLTKYAKYEPDTIIIYH